MKKKNDENEDMKKQIVELIKLIENKDEELKVLYDSIA
jgi:hypothetical protein